MYFQLKPLNYLFIFSFLPITSIYATSWDKLDPVEIVNESEIIAEPVSKQYPNQQNVQQVKEKDTLSNGAMYFSLTPSMLTGGEAKEYVFTDSGDILSLLNWEIKNIPTIKAYFTWDLNSWLTMNINGWTSLSSNTVKMDDYDWRDPQIRSLNTDWSHHPNTSLNAANKFDINFTSWFVKTPQYKVGVLAGYEQSRFSWTAKGGQYHYGATNASGDYIQGTAMILDGSFPEDESGIGYQQKFKAPYVGLVATYIYDKYEFNATAKISQWVKARDQDEHYARDITFYSKGEMSDYYSVTLNGGYYISPKVKLFGEVTWSAYKFAPATMTIKGDTSQSNAGISSKYYNLGIGAQYQF
ncbi:omptin family outer membrane protease [Acinetobacter nectaris]|uniref:omptin family outer membrane protease n=1 Tax=Acinetobacter nectaris TaxID=1219382 RepID=UPI001F364FD1|nr:omptin family outer membrane protease [Acinetobacter nectaris]MCF8999346.1 omptin family outer membrane protease [Acinetobacter nectaris]MCF9026627.1 omptin family outer membrane protease [Acinetobacter nectaris]